MRKQIHTACLWLFCLAVHSSLFGQQDSANWSQFRGPNGQGRSAAGDIPVTFNEKTNVLWKAALPKGESSPVIWGDRIFVTAHEAKKDKEGEKSKNPDLITFCLDRTSGKILWQKTIASPHKIWLHPTNSQASPTPAVDAKHVYVYFGAYGLIGYDHQGEKVWERRFPPPKSQYGAATSPILHKDRVILLLDDNSGKSRLLSLRKDSGDTIWERPRPFFKANWSTPMIWRHGQAEEIVVLGSRRLTSYNAADGMELWWAGGFCRETVGIPVSGEGLLFANASAMAGRGDEKWDTRKSWKIIIQRFDRNKDNQIQRSEMTEGFTIPIRPELSQDNPGWGLPTRNMNWLMSFLDKDKDGIISERDWNQAVAGFAMESQPTLLAIRPGATGDARKSHVAWKIHRGIPETPSLLYHQGRLYMIRDGGVLTCVKAADGKELYRKRLRAPGQYIASPVAAGEKVIIASVRGIVTVIRAGDELDILATNKLNEKIYATPAITDNTIYMRTTSYLYAFAEKQNAE